jgi:hypothetical protein
LSKPAQPEPDNRTPVAFYLISLHPEWPKVWDELCRLANMPSITLTNPDPYAAVAFAARQQYVRRILDLIEDGKNKPTNARGD